MRRLERGAGRISGPENRSRLPAAGARQFRASDWGGARGRAARTARARAASGLRPEVLRPPARSWLTAVGNTCATGESAARRRKENAAAERREGRLARVMGWAIFGDPKIGPLVRRTTGAAYPHQRLSALCSP